eukprot:6184406-Pleurochrysis_carterae.AAC.2
MCLLQAIGSAYGVPSKQLAARSKSVSPTKMRQAVPEGRARNGITPGGHSHGAAAAAGSPLRGPPRKRFRRTAQLHKGNVSSDRQLAGRVIRKHGECFGWNCPFCLGLLLMLRQKVEHEIGLP